MNNFVRIQLKNEEELQCAGCGKVFKDTYSFYEHRQETKGYPRRCLSEEEMIGKGFFNTNNNGYTCWDAQAPEFKHWYIV